MDLPDVQQRRSCRCHGSGEGAEVVAKTCATANAIDMGSANEMFAMTLHRLAENGRSGIVHLSELPPTKKDEREKGARDPMGKACEVPRPPGT
jgi:hypothetical protein